MRRLFEPFLWWLYKTPLYLLRVGLRAIVLLDHALDFTLHIRLLFVPLFGDYTLSGRIIGFFLRLLLIILGALSLLLLLLLVLLSPLVWFLLPVLVYQFSGIAGVFLYFGVLYLLRLWLTRDIPQKRVSQVDAPRVILAVRPGALRLLRASLAEGTLTPLLESGYVSDLLLHLELDASLVSASLAVPADLPMVDVVGSAFKLARSQGARYVEYEHLFYAVLAELPDSSKFLVAQGLSLEIFAEAVAWLVLERDRIAGVFFWQPDYKLRRLGGFGHGMVGHVTPYLDSVSTDFTDLARRGLVRGIVAHKAEISQLAELLSGDSLTTKPHVLILGAAGSGKTSIVKGLAQLIIEGTDYPDLRNKRVVSVDSGSLVSGTSSPGEVSARFKHIISEARSSGDIILFFDDLHNFLSGASDASPDASTVYATLTPYLSEGTLQVIASSDQHAYHKYIEPNQAFASLFHILAIDPASPEETRAVLKHMAFDIAKFDDVLVSLPAIHAIVDLSSDLIYSRVFPDKAVDILQRCVQVASKHGSQVTVPLVREVISEMTKVPVTTLSQDDSEKLLHLAEEMRKHVIGQDHAIDLLASALKRARLGLKTSKGPIASFLFVGSTGVGKTETAKSLARVYFGSESNLVRVDMSEYQNLNSLDKLLGSPDGAVQGYLTSAVKDNPFTVVLLDELEKAHPKLLMTFLQMLDDGRLTDGAGNLVNFEHTIIIATSNVGTRTLQTLLSEGKSFDVAEQAVLREVKSHFAPEFLNRFSAVVVFHTLAPKDVVAITRLLLSRVASQLQADRIDVSFSDDLVQKLAERGYSLEWGARPLKRLIADTVETYMADLILSGKVHEGDRVRLDASILD